MSCMIDLRYESAHRPVKFGEEHSAKLHEGFSQGQFYVNASHGNVGYSTVGIICYLGIKWWVVQGSNL